jgi:hypothetical protein
MGVGAVCFQESELWCSNSWHCSSALRSPRSDFRLALALAGGQCLIACCEATGNTNKGSPSSLLPSFQCSLPGCIPHSTALLLPPPSPFIAILRRLVCIARGRRGRLRVWIKNSRHAALSHTIVPAARVRRHVVALKRPILNHAKRDGYFLHQAAPCYRLTLAIHAAHVVAPSTASQRMRARLCPALHFAHLLIFGST